MRARKRRRWRRGDEDERRGGARGRLVCPKQGGSQGGARVRVNLGEQCCCTASPRVVWRCVVFFPLSRRCRLTARTPTRRTIDEPGTRVWNRGRGAGRGDAGAVAG